MKFRAILLATLYSLLATLCAAQTAGTETVVVQKTPAKATGKVPTVQANGKVEWDDPALGVTDGDKGDVVVTGTGTAWALDASGVSAGTYTYGTITIDAKGRITSAANGTNPLNADNISSGTLADARIASTIARDSEVTAAVSAAIAASITNGVTTSAPNQDQVFDALALKGNLSGGNSWSGVQIQPGSFIRTPSTVAITEASPDLGTFNIDLAKQTATIDEATTFSFSAVGSSGQTIRRKIVNSTGSPVVATLTGCTPSTTTIAANATQDYEFESNGIAWVMPGGDPYAALPIASGGTGATSAAAAATALGLGIDASGFDGNLTGTDDTIQEVAQKLDDLTAGGAGMVVGTSFGFNPAKGSLPSNALLADGTNGTDNLGAVNGTSTVWYTIGGGTVATPTVDIPAGTYPGTQNITATSATSGATLRYTTNGVDPTTGDTTVSGAIPVTTSGTLKVKAWKDLYAASAVFSAAYTINSGFAWDMESTTATGAGDTSATLNNATLSTAQFQGGAQSLSVTGAFNDANFSQASNPDYDFDIGTIDVYFRWTGTWGGGSLVTLSPTSGLGKVEVYRVGSDLGQVRLKYTDSAGVANYITVTGASTADTWYRITGKWRTASSPYLSIARDGGTAVTGTTALTPITDTEDLIRVGNVTSTSTNINYYIDSLTITTTW